MSDSHRTTVHIQNKLERIAAGEDHSIIRDELLTLASRRIRALVGTALSNRRDLARWEEADDLFQNVLVRIDRAVRDARPASTREFFGLVAQHVRWETTDLIRHHFGPEGAGRHHRTRGLEGPLDEELFAMGPPDHPESTGNPLRIHEAVEHLEPEQREPLLLRVYAGLKYEEIAASLGVSTKTVQRRIRAAKVALAAALDETPDAGP